MSQENVELVRAFLHASSQGDTETLMAALGPEIEWTPVMEDPDYLLTR
jgi:ketosteroid isomerase-like protein